MQFQASLLPASLPDAGHVELNARYRPAPEGIDIGGDWYDAFERPDGSVRISSAGHLPPRRVGRGSASLLTGCVDPPLRLGVPGRRSYAAQLAVGETIVLYTDGPIERRRGPLDRSLDRLVHAGQALGPRVRQANEIVARLMDDFAHDAKDDVAILAATLAERCVER